LLLFQAVPDHKDLPGDQKSLHKPERLQRHLHRHLPGEKIPVAISLFSIPLPAGGTRLV